MTRYTERVGTPLALAKSTGNEGRCWSAGARKAGPAQAMVEFALAMSVFMLLVLGTFDLARAYVAYTVVANAAREAARYGVAHQGESGWQGAAVQAGRNLAVGVDPSAVQINVTASAGPPVTISVTGSYQFHSLTPLVGALLGDPINMQVQTAALAG